MRSLAKVRLKTHHRVRIIGCNCGYDGSLNSIGSNHASIEGLSEDRRKVIHVLQRKEKKDKNKQAVVLNELLCAGNTFVVELCKIKVFWSPLIEKFPFPFMFFVHDLGKWGKKLLQTFRKKQLPAESKSCSEPEKLIFKKKHKCGWKKWNRRPTVTTMLKKWSAPLSEMLHVYRLLWAVLCCAMAVWHKRTGSTQTNFSEKLLW